MNLRIRTVEFDATVYTQGDQLFVEGLEGGNRVELIDGNGRLLENRVSTGGNERFVLPSKGFYLLKVDGAVCKVQY